MPTSHTTAVTPKPGETQSDFYARAHKELMKTIPAAEDRNAVVIEQWARHRGPDAASQRAAKEFSGSEYVRRFNVPIFCEHETVDSKGRAQRYSVTELKAIIDKCNKRISDTGDFAALTDGHTPTRDEFVAGAKQPDVLGYMGPFRLGMIGDEKPRYAILADETYYADTANRVKRLPRRSVELWMANRMSDRFVDPVAALGAEAPRLDLGMRFAKLPSGTKVAKYAGPASAVMPGGGNTFIPAADKYDSYTDPQGSNPGSPTMLTNEDVRQIIQALDSLDWVQHVKDMMAAGDAPAADTDPGLDNPPATEDEAPVEDYMGDEEAPLDEEAPQNFDELAPPGDIPGGEMDVAEPPPSDMAPSGAPPADAPPPEPGPEDEEDELYNCERDDEEDEDELYARSQDRGGYKDRYRREVSRYRKLAGENQELKARYNKLAGQVGGMRRRSSDSERDAQLEKYRMQFAFDLDDERRRCLYSLGSKMTPAQFEDHLEMIRDNYRKVPHSQVLPHGEVSLDADREKYEARMSEEAVKYCESQRRAGNPISFQLGYEVVVERSRASNGKVLAN